MARWRLLYLVSRRGIIHIPQKSISTTQVLRCTSEFENGCNQLFPQTVFICSYWKTFKHTLCVELLSSGFHLSFDEIFNLIQEQKKRCSPNEKKQKPLEEEKDKLRIIKKQLMEAESAVLSGKFCHYLSAEWRVDMRFQLLWTHGLFLFAY